MLGALLHVWRFVSLQERAELLDLEEVHYGAGPCLRCSTRKLTPRIEFENLIGRAAEA
jgi:hypothetical protein